VCEVEVSQRCPYGWAYYVDTDGSEGTDSCLLVSPTTALSWSAANASCPAGSHLLTVKSSLSTRGLLPFATSLFVGSGLSQKVYVGCRCVPCVSILQGLCLWFGDDYAFFARSAGYLCVCV
jgi:hypothetical protein